MIVHTRYGFLIVATTKVSLAVSKTALPITPSAKSMTQYARTTHFFAL